MDSHARELAKVLTHSILGVDYREPEKESLYRRVKKCLYGYWQSLFGFLLGH